MLPTKLQFSLVFFLFTVSFAWSSTSPWHHNPWLVCSCSEEDSITVPFSWPDLVSESIMKPNQNDCSCFLSPLFLACASSHQDISKPGICLIGSKLSLPLTPFQFDPNCNLHVVTYWMQLFVWAYTCDISLTHVNVDILGFVCLLQIGLERSFCNVICFKAALHIYKYYSFKLAVIKGLQTHYRACEPSSSASNMNSEVSTLVVWMLLLIINF